MSHARKRLLAEDGFTLVELLVGSSLSVILLLATLATFDAFGSASKRNEKLVTTQDAVRQQIDRISGEIRNAQISSSGQDPLLRANPTDLVVRNIDAAGNATLIRYCVDTTTRSLWRETAVDGTTPGSTCPSTGGSWQRAKIVSGTIANSATDALFIPNTATVSSIRSVEISLHVDTGTAGGRTTRLQTGVALRSASGRPLNLPASAVGVTCQGGNALLNLTVGNDDTGSPLTAIVTTSAGVSLGTFDLSTAATIGASVQGALTITVKNALGLQQILFKTVSCP